MVRPTPWPAPVLLGSALLASAGTRAGELEAYALDPVHTRVLFAIDHAGLSSALGTISGSTGTLRFDRDDWRTAQLDVTVPLARLDLGEAKWNAAALASSLLDAKRHPEARFVSRQVEPLGPDQARVCGELSLRGTARPVCLDVTLNALKRHPLPPFRRTAGFSATGVLSRRDFGMDAWPTVIGDRVALRIEVEAVRQAQDGAPAAAPPPAGMAPPDAGAPGRESGPPVPASDVPSSPPPATSSR